MSMLICVAGQGANGLDDAGRAATVIHEATHQLAKTGDDVNQKGNIIKPYDSKSIPNGETGCACPKNFTTKTETELGLQTRAIPTYTRLSTKSKQTPGLQTSEIRQLTCTITRSPMRKWIIVLE
jgi:hypothetical protein